MPLYFGGSPDIQAKLHLGGTKDIVIDLAPYIKSLSISKDLSQPAGMWELQCSRGVLNVSDLTPFDYLEMQVRSDPGLARPFYYTRGFVDNVSVATDGTSGRVNRNVTINGRDYGALLQNYQIFNVTPSQQLASFIFQVLTQEIGFSQGAISVNELVWRIIHKALNDRHIQGITNGTKDPAIPGLISQQPKIKNIQTLVHMPDTLGTTLALDNLLSFNGTLDELIRQIQSPPWGEYFIRDDPDGPRVYFRVPPYLKRDGTFANPWIALGKAHAYNTELELMWVELTDQDIMSTNLTKSQNEVYTFFVSSIQGGVIQGDLIQAVLANQFTDNLAENKNPYFDGLDTGNPQSLRRAARFGFRPLEIQSPLVSGTNVNKVFTALSDPKDANGTQEMARMNTWLKDSMGRMEELESGTITCRGIMGTRRGHNEIAARVGDYVYFRHNPREDPYYYYVQALDISWAEGSPITSTFQVIRGEQLTNKEHPYRI